MRSDAIFDMIFVLLRLVSASMCTKHWCVLCHPSLPKEHLQVRDSGSVGLVFLTGGGGVPIGVCVCVTFV